MSYTQQDQDKYLADLNASREARLAADRMRIRLAVVAQPDTVAMALAELVEAWGISGTYEMADQFTCSETEAIAKVLEAIGEGAFADAFRWGHAQGDDDLIDGNGAPDPEAVAEYGERHFLITCEPVTAVNESLTRFVTPGMVTVNLPEQDVQA